MSDSLDEFKRKLEEVIRLRLVHEREVFTMSDRERTVKLTKIEELEWVLRDVLGVSVI